MVALRGTAGALTGVVLLVAWAVGTASAQQADAQPDDTKSREILRSALDLLTQAKTVRVECRSRLNCKQFDPKRTVYLSADIAVQRPNRMAMISTGASAWKDDALVPLEEAGVFPDSVASDGETIRHYDAEKDTFAENAASAELPEMEERASASGVDVCAGIFAIQLLTDRDAYELFTAPARVIRHAGIEEYRGLRCHHIIFSPESNPIEFWIDAGEKPIIHRIRKRGPFLSWSAAAGKPEPSEEGTDEHYANWQFDVDLPAETFSRTRLEQAQRMAQAARKLGRLDPALALLGQPAPTASLKLLDGGSFDIAAQNGKHVVILDFWATWCRDCQRGLPIVAKVAEEYRARGVVFCAVNFGEKAEKITGLLKEKGWSMPVALDVEKGLSERYLVHAIPQTVIIDQHGVVRFMHFEAPPDVEQRLRAELDTLVSND